jgi:hypothetical protein
MEMPDQVKVRKEELLQALRENRAAHRDIFERAVDGYRTAALAKLEERIQQVRDGKLMPVIIQMPVPEDHTRDYDRAIRMVEMEVENTIELDEAEFAHLVMDDWAWKQQWLSSTAAYVAMEK